MCRHVVVMLAKTLVGMHVQCLSKYLESAANEAAALHTRQSAIKMLAKMLCMGWVPLEMHIAENLVSGSSTA